MKNTPKQKPKSAAELIKQADWGPGPGAMAQLLAHYSALRDLVIYCQQFVGTKRLPVRIRRENVRLARYSPAKPGAAARRVAEKLGGELSVAKQLQLERRLCGIFRLRQFDVVLDLSRLPALVESKLITQKRACDRLMRQR